MVEPVTHLEASQAKIDDPGHCKCYVSSCNSSNVMCVI